MRLEYVNRTTMLYLNSMSNFEQLLWDMTLIHKIVHVLIIFSCSEMRGNNLKYFKFFTNFPKGNFLLCFKFLILILIDHPFFFLKMI